MAAVCISGKRSHPVIFNRKWYGELHRLKGDKGARELFVKHPEDVCLFEAGESYNDMDIDTPEDYEEFKKSIIPPI
jgi:molybdenum cofactor cytidylyltransferase